MLHQRSTHRMRRFAEDLCWRRRVAVTFRGPDSGKGVAGRLCAGRSTWSSRRVSTTPSPPGCAQLRIEFRQEGGELRLTVADNGWPIPRPRTAATVKSIRERAPREGSVEWQSGPAGTTVEFRRRCAPRRRISDRMNMRWHRAADRVRLKARL
jgi:hypothetical protein